MKILLSIIISLFVFCGCANKKNNGSNKDLSVEIMDVHDEVMGKLSKIMQLKMQLADSLAAKDSTALDFASYKLKSIELQKQLEKDDAGMMNWMSQYNEDTLTVLGMEDGKLYLEGQKKQILNLKDATYKDLELAESFLNLKK